MVDCQGFRGVWLPQGLVSTLPLNFVFLLVVLFMPSSYPCMAMHSSNQHPLNAGHTGGYPFQGPSSGGDSDL